MQTLGEDIVYSKKFKAIPTLNIPYPIFERLALKLEIPSPQSIFAILLKIITLKRARFVEQILKEVSQLGQQGSYANKILLIFVVALCLIPLRKSERPNLQRPSTPDTKYAMSIEKSDKQAISINLQILSVRTQSQQLVFANTWSIIYEQLRIYNITILQRSEEVLQLMYDQPLFQGIARLPSLLRIDNQKDVQLTYHYDRHMKGIQLREFLQLTSLVEVGEQCYHFSKFMIDLAHDLLKQIRKENINQRFYFVLTFDNVFVCTGEKSIVEINLLPVQMSNWNLKKIPAEFNECIYSDKQAKNSAESTKTADLWSMGIILLEAIAFSSNIPRFKKQLKSCRTFSEGKECLNEFLTFIEEENLIVNDYLLRRIKICLRLVVDDFQQLEKSQSNEDFEAHYREAELQRLYAVDEGDNEDQNHEFRLEDQQGVHMNEYNQPINTDEFILNIQQLLMIYSSKIVQIFAEPLSQSSLLRIENQIWKKSQFYNAQSVKNPQKRRQLFNQYLVKHAQGLPLELLYCSRTQCIKKPTIYEKKLSRIFLCKTCNIAYCSACRNFLHAPLKCDVFQSLLDGISDQVFDDLQLLGWSKLNQSKFKSYQKKLGLQSTKLFLNLRIIVRELLILDRCQLLSNTKGTDNRHSFKMLAEKVMNLLTKVYTHCKNGSSYEVQCVQSCFQLNKIHDARQQILVSVFI